jgi:pyruvate,water dikinase
MTVVTMTKAAPLNETLDEAAYGGKAAQLSAAVRAGLPVPPGVAVPVDIVAAIAAGDGAAQRELEQAIVNLTFPWRSAPPPSARTQPAPASPVST